jgi:hypothetical protein
MNWAFVSAGILMVVIGLVHSVLGERLIFRRMRAGGRIPTNGGSLLREGHVRILWATWHLATALALGMAALLVWCAGPAAAPLARSAVPPVIGLAAFAGALLVLVGTKGRHPGWIGLLIAAVLTALGMG